MQLTLLFDHRFLRDSEGRISSPKNYTPEFFATRYLRVFDHVRIVARVDDRCLSAPALGEIAWGPKVTVVPVGNWTSAVEWWRQRRKIQRTLHNEVSSAEAIIAVVPGLLADVAFPWLRQRRYGVEVVGDPYDSLAPGTIRHPLRPILRVLAPRSLRKLCRHAAVASYVTRQALQRRYPPGPQTRAFGCSDVVLPEEAFSPGSREFVGSPSRSLTLVNVGTMAVNYKRQDLLIQALATLVGRGHDLRLKLIGDGRFCAGLKELAQRLQVADRVQFCGWVPAGEGVRSHLDEADVFVMPSIQEGLPRAIVEAMARGLPCLASRVGGIPELLDDGELFEPNSLAALTESIAHLIVDPARMAALSQRNRLAAEEFHDHRLNQLRLEFYELVAQGFARMSRAA